MDIAGQQISSWNQSASQEEDGAQIYKKAKNRTCMTMPKGNDFLMDRDLPATAPYTTYWSRSEDQRKGDKIFSHEWKKKDERKKQARKE